MSNSWFAGRKLVIATKHKKEEVIAPLLVDKLGVQCFTAENFDTDTLGTFSGEIERELDPIATLRKKCWLAMEANHCDLGVASEGSFGAHPTLFFTSADDEFLILIDKKNDLEIIARELSTATNFSAKEVQTHEELLDFAEAAKFPSHGLILRKSNKDISNLVKGITDFELLEQTFKRLKKESDTVQVETDMRALYNPTRMMVIEKAAKKLVEKANSHCPKCQTPGFDVTEVKRGLACNLCGLPTKSTLSYIYQCKRCEFVKEEMYPHQKTTEDPMYCDFCNP